MKVIIAGGRDFLDTRLMDETIKELVRTGWMDDDSTLVCGMARGADELGRALWVQTYDLPVERFPADWATHGKRAGFIRNTEMAHVADKLVAFWDGQSRGTKHMIETMQRLNKPVHIVHY